MKIPPAEEPVAYAIYADSGSNIRLWSQDRESAERWAAAHGRPLVPLYTAPPALADHDCNWKCADDIEMPGTWEGSCGTLWTFTAGGPAENSMLYCPQCGRRVMLAAAPEVPRG